MITVDEAFKKFLSRLELSHGEQDDASRRQKEIRGHMNESFEVDRDFLTGSYARWTKTKPLKDVDIFCVLGDGERHYRDKHPSELLMAVEKAMSDKYGSVKVNQQRRSVEVRFGVIADENEDTGGKVMSFDVVPAFTKSNHYEIPDTAVSSGWTETNPEIHAQKAVDAHAAYGKQWKPIVRMVKKWNSYKDKPVNPSFLIEVMALDLLNPPYGGDLRREVKSFFATLADHIHGDWPDPAGLGPHVSDSMDSAACAAAKSALMEASNQAAKAIQFEKQGKTTVALRIWRDEIFGPLFPLS